MPPVKISQDLTIALAKKDMEETEETAQVKSSLMIEGTIATDADSFVLHALLAHQSRDILAHFDLGVVAMLYRLEQEATGSLHFA